MKLYDKIDTLFVVVHDSGAAELIFSMLPQLKYQKLIFCIDGIAKNTIKKYFNKFNNKSLDYIRYLTNQDFVLTGRSKTSNLEVNAIKFANKYNIPNATLIDHWTNYDTVIFPKNFTSRQKDNFLNIYLPNTIIVTDKYAYKLANSITYFKNRVILEKNYYLDNILNKQKHIKKTSMLVVVLDPLSINIVENHNNKNIFGFTEYDIIIQIKKYWKYLRKLGIQRVIIRPHPRHILKDFIHITNKILHNSNIPYKIKYKNNIIDDIAIAHTVIGIDSMALYFAERLNKTVYSLILNNKNKKLTIPSTKIKVINSIKKIKGK